MFESIWEDIKREFRMGNMVTKLMIANGAVYVAFLLILIVSRGLSGGEEKYQWFVNLFSMPGSGWKLLIQPWSLVSHMFLHEGFWHIFWNMLWLMWFGRIAGDLLGDRKILPLYLLSGVCGAIFYLTYCFLFGAAASYALGASAAVSGIVLAAAVTAPDYGIRLILIGDVKIKYIAAFKILMDIVAIAGSDNVGGNIAHLGGAFYGYLYVTQLRQGVDLGGFINRWIDGISGWLRSNKKRPVSSSPRTKTPMTVVHKENRRPMRRAQPKSQETELQRMDSILEKIHQQGIDSLTDEEKDFLESTRKKI